MQGGTMTTTSAATAVSAARSRLSRPSPPTPWGPPPASRSRTVAGFSFSGSAVGCRRLTADAGMSHCAVPAAWRRRRSKCSRSGSSTGATMSAVELQPSLELKAKAAELMESLKGTSLFLVGMNGPMKTKLGKVLADALGYCYFDSDNLVEEAAGGARDFRERDESGFRESETEVLRQLSSMARLVVCAGDGAVQGVTNLSYLRYGISLWVDIPVDIIADEKLKDGVQFPNAQDPSDAFDEAVTELARQYEKMKGGYATADATVSLLKVATKLGYVELGDVTPEDMALEVLREIEKLTRMKKMMEDAARPF